MVEFPGSACDYEYGEGCEEGISVCREFDDGGDIWADIRFGGGIEWLVAQYRNELQRMINKGWLFLFVFCSSSH